MTPVTKDSVGWLADFEEIRCYEDDEVNAVLKELAEDDVFVNSLETFIQKNHASPDRSKQAYLAELQAIDSIDAFQAWIEASFLPAIENSYSELTISGLDNLSPDSPYLFISNHRDIVMDPLILNLAIKRNGMKTAHCAIGDNLLQSKTAYHVSMLNRCFKVSRSLRSPKAILRAMRIQSAYIRYRHEQEKSHIWIAQKEGRSKDNSDLTNPALIKMLALARPKEESLQAYLNSLNVVPVCLSYEWDPCDIDKARQLNDATHQERYEKQTLDDLNAVNKGLSGWKGGISIAFGKPLKLDGVEANHTTMAQEIDQWIHHAYRLFPNNFAAFKKVYPNVQIDSMFPKEKVHEAQRLLEKRLVDTPELEERVYKAYAKPLAYTYQLET